MARVRETWISSTLATEFVSLAAARAVLEVWDGTDVAAHIADATDLSRGMPSQSVPGGGSGERPRTSAPAQVECRLKVVLRRSAAVLQLGQRNGPDPLFAVCYPSRGNVNYLREFATSVTVGLPRIARLVCNE
jgi:hypothetical protein